MDSAPDFDGSHLSKYAKSLKILHLSDAHIRVDPGSTDQKARVEAFIQGLSQDLEGEVVHLVAMTGDIASSGLAEEYENFIAWVFEPLCALPALKDARWCLVPGNHDVDFSADFADQRAIKEYGTESLLEPGNTGVKTRRHLHNRFKSFSALWNRLNASGHKTVCPQDWLEDPGYYVACESLDGLMVRIIGLNTAWCEQRPGVRSFKPFPVLGARLLEEALALQCPRYDLTLVIGHHHLDPSGKDTADFEAALSSAQALYLHGHGHEPELTSRTRQDDLVVTLMANAIDLGPQNDNPPLLYQKTGYTLISLDAKAQSFLFRPMTWHRGAFVLDSRYSWMTEENGWFRAWRCSPPTDGRSIRIKWPRTEGNIPPAPTRQDWIAFFTLGEPTEAIVSALPQGVTPVDDAIDYLQTPTNTSRIIRLDAPSGEGTSSVFLMIAKAMARLDWRVHVQGETDPFYQTIPESLRAETRNILLCIRPPQDEDEFDYLNIFIRKCRSFPNIWLMMNGTRWDWGNNLSLLQGAKVISWGQKQASAWIGKSTRLAPPGRLLHEDLCRGKHNDQSDPKRPVWSLFGELVSAHKDSAPNAVGDRLRRHRERMASGTRGLKGDDTLRLFDIIATVHAAAGAILTRDVLAQACFSGNSSLLKAHLEWLEPEIRTLTVKRQKVFVGRHLAVSAAHASMTGTAPLEAAFAAARKQRLGDPATPFWTDWLTIAPNQKALAELERECEHWSLEEQIALLRRWKEVSGTAPQPSWHRNLCLNIAEFYRGSNDWKNVITWIAHALGTDPQAGLPSSSYELNQIMESVLYILREINHSPCPYDLKNSVLNIVINIESYFSNRKQNCIYSIPNLLFDLENLKKLVSV